MSDGPGQADSTGGWEAADETEVDETDQGDATEDHNEVDPDAEVDDDQDADEQDGRRPTKEANLRRRAQAAEAERDQLRDQLDATRQSIVEDIASSMRLDARLLAAGGHEVAEFLDDDGHLDRGAVVEALREVAREFGVQRGIAPNPLHGHQGIAGRGRGGVGDTIAKALGRQ
jgi:hypothetical protein